MAFVTHFASLSDRLVDRLGLAPARTGERIKGFDGVRGIAAILVLAHHTLLTDRHLGAVSVYVFFALSGFLIIKSLHETRVRVDRETGSAALEFGKFVWRRAVRLTPSYYVALAALCLFFLATGRQFGDVYQYRAYYATFTQNLLVAFVTQKWGAFTQTWSLAVEQQAYLICGLALLVIPARRHGAALAVLAAASFAASLAAAKAPDGGLMFYCLPFNGLVYMLIGGGFAIYGPKASQAVRLGERAGSAIAAALAVAILAAAFTADGPSIVEWAPGVYGAEAAARHHFGVSASDLTAQQAAQLAAALPNPKRRNAGKPGPRVFALARRLKARAAAQRAGAACVLGKDEDADGSSGG